jgi:hypothetical protein
LQKLAALLARPVQLREQSLVSLDTLECKLAVDSPPLGLELLAQELRPE